MANWRILRWLLVLGATAPLGVLGCGAATTTCTNDQGCVSNGSPGRCLPSPASSSMWCAFGNNTCPSGYAWGSSAGDNLAGCTPGGMAGADMTVTTQPPDMAMPIPSGDLTGVIQDMTMPPPDMLGLPLCHLTTNCPLNFTVLGP